MSVLDDKDVVPDETSSLVILTAALCSGTLVSLVLAKHWGWWGSGPGMLASLGLFQWMRRERHRERGAITSREASIVETDQVADKLVPDAYERVDGGSQSRWVAWKGVLETRRAQVVSQIQAVEDSLRTVDDNRRAVQIQQRRLGRDAPDGDVSVGGEASEALRGLCDELKLLESDLARRVNAWWTHRDDLRYLDVLWTTVELTEQVSMVPAHHESVVGRLRRLAIYTSAEDEPTRRGCSKLLGPRIERHHEDLRGPLGDDAAPRLSARASPGWCPTRRHVWESLSDMLEQVVGSLTESEAGGTPAGNLQGLYRLLDEALSSAPPSRPPNELQTPARKAPGSVAASWVVTRHTPGRDKSPRLSD